jgi:uncharacterized protein (TIGR02217 family)
MRNHHDVRLPFFLYPFLLSSFSFESHLITSYSCRDFIKNNRDFPVHTYKITAARINTSQFEEFYAFFNARCGSLYSFCLKDFGDYAVVDQLLAQGAAEGVKFKLFKKYEDSKNPSYRHLSLIIPESIKLKKNYADIEFRYLRDSYEVEIAEALRADDRLQVSFKFDVKVRFITNKIEYTYCSDGSILLNDIIIREVIDV